MAGVRKKTYIKNGKQVTRYYIVYKDINGNQCSGGGYETRKEALRHLTEFEDIQAEGDVTLKYIFDLFKKKSIKYAKSTRSMYDTYYERYFKEIENIKYKRLTSVQLQSIFDKIEADSPYIAIICMKMCKSAVNNAIKKKIITVNKFNDVDPIKKPKAQHKHLTVEKIKEILEIAKKGIKGFEKNTKKYYTMLYVFIGTGMRAGEIIALSPSDFDYKTKTLDVNKQYTKKELKDVKTTNSNRIVYVFQELADVIEDYKQDIEGDILFPSEKGSYIDLRNFSERYWKKLKETAGITDRVRLHDLRGSYIDMLLSSGLSPKFAQNQVGHAKTQTTLDVYAQNNADMIGIAEEKMDKIFKSGGKSVEKVGEVEKPKVISFSEARAKRNKKAPYGTF